MPLNKPTYSYKEMLQMIPKCDDEASIQFLIDISHEDRELYSKEHRLKLAQLMRTRYKYIINE